MNVLSWFAVPLLLEPQTWQSDMLFGPWVQRSAGGKRQVFLQATLDDASRLIPHAQFYPNQGLDAFLDCLRQSIGARGVPTRLYMDNAKIYRSPQLARIAASIGIPKAAARSSASSARYANSFSPRSIPRRCCRSSN